VLPARSGRQEGAHQGRPRRPFGRVISSRYPVEMATPAGGHLFFRVLFTGMSKSAHETFDEVRLDLWLWAARFFKTRSLAKQAIESSKVEVGGQLVKPSRGARVGDALRVR